MGMSRKVQDNQVKEFVDGCQDPRKSGCVKKMARCFLGTQSTATRDVADHPKRLFF
jgi:hypothetical protein